MNAEDPALNQTPAGSRELALRSLLQPAAGGEIADCWNRKGVGGDGSCPELANFIHCRNCPVYSAAAAQLLERPLPAGYRPQWTAHYARELGKPSSLGKSSVVIFRLGAEWLSLPTRVFHEIAERRVVHSLPHRRQGVVLGLVNVRGALLICVSLGQVLGLTRETAPNRSRTVYDRLVVAEWEGKPLCFPVNEVHGIHRHHPEELQPPPAAAKNGGLIRGVLAWQKKRVACLDEESLFAALNRSLA